MIVDAWTLHRPDGGDRLCLGGLRPGMTREEAAEAAASYGPIRRVEDHGSRVEGMAAGFEGIEQFGFSVEEIAIARQAWEDAAEHTRDLIIEHRGLADPTLDYEAGRLSRVAMDHHCERLSFLGRPVFDDDVPALLKALQTMEGGEALRQGDTVWFPRLEVMLIGFHGERPDGSVGVLGGPDDPMIRHLCLEPYIPVSDAPTPVGVVF